MGGYTGKYSRSPLTVFNEEKNYAFALMQEGVPVTDDDANADRLELFTRLRRGNQLFGNYGTPNDGFRVQQATSTANNFKLTGGGVGNTDIEQAGKFFMRGISCLLLRDVDYYNSLSDIAEQSIHPRITFVYFDGLDTVVEDSAAGWVTNELAGRYVRINGLNKLIASNDQDSFKISGDHTTDIAALDYYILLLAPPGSGTRDDAVYLNVYLDEYDGDDDPEITKRIGGTEVVAQLRAKIIQTLFVRQDNPTHGDLSDYLDSNGNQHYIFKIARIRRTTANDILTADIDDYVLTIGFDDIDQYKLTMLRAVPNIPNDNTVYVSPGQAMKANENELVTWAGGIYATGFAVQPTNARWDLLYLKDDGTLDVIQGVPAASPTKPTFPWNGTPICYVYIDEPTTVIVSGTDVVDARTFLGDHDGFKTIDPTHGTLNQQLSTFNLATGDRIRVKPGTYTVSGNIDITVPVSFECVDGTAIFDMADDQLLLNTGSSGSMIKGIEFRSTVQAWNSMVEVFANVSKVVFNGCKFTASGTSTRRYHGVELKNGVNRVKFIRCDFDDCMQGDASHLSSGLLFVASGNVADYILVEECTFFYDGSDSSTASENRSAILVEGVGLIQTGWRILNSKFNHNRSTQTNANLHSIKFHRPQRLIINGCIFDRNEAFISLTNKSTALTLTEVRLITVSYCDIQNHPYGIYVTGGAEDKKIIGNRINYEDIVSSSGATQLYGIYAYIANKLIIEGNDVYMHMANNHQPAGIYIYYCHRTRIIGNNIYVSGTNINVWGIQAVSCNYCVIANNVSSTYSGIIGNGSCYYMYNLETLVFSDNVAYGDMKGTGTGSLVYFSATQHAVISGLNVDMWGGAVTMTSYTGVLFSGTTGAVISDIIVDSGMISFTPASLIGVSFSGTQSTITLGHVIAENLFSTNRGIYATGGAVLCRASDFVVGSSGQSMTGWTVVDWS